MDDRKFDSIVRAKLEDYHHPAMGQSALDALHQQNSAIPAAPWYSRHRTELIITSGITLLVVLYLLGTTFLTRTVSLDEQQNNIISVQRAQIEQLTKEVGRLQRVTTDTVRVVEVRTEHSALIEELMRRIALLEKSNETLMLQEERSIIVQSQANGEDILPFHPMSNFLATSQPIDSAINKEHEALQNQQSNSPQKSLDAKSIRALEKHYSHGVGIKLGPTADIFGSHYSLGNGHLSFSGGILAEFIMSPSLGVETGVKYSERFYAIRDEQLSGSSLPGVDGQFGNLQGAEVDYRLLEVPLNLKYRYPLSLNAHWIAGVGYSSLIYLNEAFEYTYELDNQSPNPASIVSTVSTDEVKVYAGTINISLGMSHLLKNRKIVEASLFYNHGIGTQGIEKTRAQYFGLRGAYWFTAR